MSIRAAYNSGIIDYSINGTKKYQEEAKKEESVLSNTESFMASILSKIKELENEDDEESEEEDITVPDILRRYVLGADYSGRDINSLLIRHYDSVFIDDENSITDASTSILYLNEMYEDGEVEDWTEYIYINYEQVAYKIIVEYNQSESASITKDVVYVYKPKANSIEGGIVGFSVDGTSEAIDWLVLYDNGETIDITPVELDDSWMYPLSSADPAAIAALPSGSDVERSIWSYNHAVETLNSYCNTIITNSAAQAVRSVGTGFGVTDTSTTYSSTFLANNPSGSAGTYNNVGLSGDTNAEQDLVRMSFYSPGDSYIEHGYASAVNANTAF